MHNDSMAGSDDGSGAWTGERIAQPFTKNADCGMMFEAAYAQLCWALCQRCERNGRSLMALHCHGLYTLFDATYVYVYAMETHSKTIKYQFVLDRPAKKSAESITLHAMKWCEMEILHGNKNERDLIKCIQNIVQLLSAVNGDDNQFEREKKASGRWSCLCVWCYHTYLIACRRTHV